MSDDADHPPSFQFYPGDFLGSTAVSAMCPEAIGGYILLLCHAWKQPECGVIPDDETLLAALSRLAGRWPEHRIAIRRAFAERTRDGKPVLVQLRMVKEREAQRKRYKQAAEGARITNEKRSTSFAQRTHSARPAGRSAVAPSSSSSSSSESTSTPPGEEPPREWAKGFDEWWQEYPRKVSREAARVAYMKLRPRTQETYDLLFSGLALHKRTEWSDREPDKIPHASTWLNQGRFRDAEKARPIAIEA